MKLTIAAVAFACALLSSSAYATCYGICFDADDVAKSVTCKAKDVVVLAKSDADCKTLGGEVAKLDEKK